MDTPGGRETLLLVASSKPLDYLESEIRGFQVPETGLTDSSVREIPPKLVRRVLGIGLMVEEEPTGEKVSDKGRLNDVMQTLVAGKEEVRGVWIRRIELENPADP